VLNFQLLCPEHIVGGIGEHYITLDFTGWRYFQLIEPEGERFGQYSWPYGNPYAIYRESTDHAHVASLALWYNNLPPGGKVACSLSPIKALPLVAIRLVNPAIVVDGKEVLFPAELESGSYLELSPEDGCSLYGPQGEARGNLVFWGDVPTLRRGKNRISFSCEGVKSGGAPGARARAKVTVIAFGDALR
jgi:hypothetical protein